MPAWQQENRELETTPPKEYQRVNYPVPKKVEDLVRSFEQITDIVRNKDATVQIIDARSTKR